MILIKNLNNNSWKRYFFKESQGQLSLEFLLISFLAILILVSITLPLSNLVTDIGFDSSNLLEIKSGVSKIANGIDSVYSNGAGSKRTIAVEVPKDVDIIFFKDSYHDTGLATVDYLLSDGSMKKIEISYKYLDLSSTLHLIKGYNRIIIEWPVYSNKIIVYRSI